MPTLQQYDFDSVLARMTDRVQQKLDEADPNFPAWRDAFESSTGRVLMEALAAGIDHFGFLLERRVSENYLNTARLRRSRLNIASMLGYKPGRREAATAACTLTFESAVSAALSVSAGAVLDSTPIFSVFGSYSIPVGNTAIGTGNGVQTVFSATLAKCKAGSVSILKAAVVVATDNGLGVISGTGVSGTINYTTGAVSVTFTVAPANGQLVTATYKQTFSFTAYQGEVKTYNLEISETTSYVELSDTYDLISEAPVEVIVLTADESQSFAYVKATSGPQKYTSVDRVYFPRYSYADKLRIYFGDGMFGRNPFQDGTKIKVRYMTTDGASGNTAAAIETDFTSGAPLDALLAQMNADLYSVTIPKVTSGFDAEPSEDVATNAPHYFSTGLKAVTKTDYQYLLEAMSSVSKASAWAEEDVSPPNLQMRNTVKFAALDLDGNDLDEALVEGEATILEHPPLAGTFLKLEEPGQTFVTKGILAGDTVVMLGKPYVIASVQNETTLILATGPASKIAIAEFYYVSRLNPRQSVAAIADLVTNYRTLTVRLLYEPAQIYVLSLTVSFVASPGFSVPTLVTEIQSALTTKFHKTYFSFGVKVAKSEFWEAVMAVAGVKSATIAWSVNGVVQSSDYYDYPGPLAKKQIARLDSVTVTGA